MATKRRYKRRTYRKKKRTQKRRGGGVGGNLLDKITTGLGLNKTTQISNIKKENKSNNLSSLTDYKNYPPQGKTQQQLREAATLKNPTTSNTNNNTCDLRKEEEDTYCTPGENYNATSCAAVRTLLQNCKNK